MTKLFYVLRTLMASKSSTLIKVLTLGLGLTVSAFLFIRVAYDKSFDKCFGNYDRLYQTWMIYEINGEELPKQLHCVGKLAGGTLENMPDLVESVTMCRGMGNQLSKDGETHEIRTIVADSLFFNTMGIDVLKGNPVTDMVQPWVIYLSDTAAEKMFGDEDPIGKEIVYNNNWSLVVKGIYRHWDEDRSTVFGDAVISLSTMTAVGLSYSWLGGDSWLNYILAKPGVTIDQINERMEKMMEQNVPPTDGLHLQAFVAPLRDTHSGEKTIKQVIQVLSILGIAILIITALNYVLFSLSSLARRAKAIGVHKCNGATTGSIFGMFLFETAIVLILGFIVFGIFYFVTKEYMEESLYTPVTSLLSMDYLWIIVGVLVLIFLIAAVIPGIIFSRIPVTQVFRRFSEKKRGWKFALLFVQFFGISLIAGILVLVIEQYRFIINRDPGFTSKNIVVVGNRGTYEERNGTYDHYASLPYVEEITSSDGIPGAGYYSGDIVSDNQGNMLFSTKFDWWDDNYADVTGITILEGRVPQEPKTEIIVNQKFAELMGWDEKETVGKTIPIGEKVKTVTGLMKQFDVSSAFVSPQPFMAEKGGGHGYYTYLRLAEPFEYNLTLLEKDIEETYPNTYVYMQTFDNLLVAPYHDIKVFRTITMVAMTVIFIIMIIGLGAYLKDEIQRRSREIAIRKVNGATSASIVDMLCTDILKIAVPAVVIGTLVSWYIGRLWLGQFALVIDHTTGVFILSGISVLILIVLCSIIFTYRAANANPAVSLKSE